MLLINTSLSIEVPPSFHRASHSEQEEDIRIAVDLLTAYAIKDLVVRYEESDKTARLAALVKVHQAISDSRRALVEAPPNNID